MLKSEKNFYKSQSSKNIELPSQTEFYQQLRNLGTKSDFEECMKVTKWSPTRQNQDLEEVEEAKDKDFVKRPATARTQCYYCKIIS